MNHLPADERQSVKKDEIVSVVRQDGHFLFCVNGVEVKPPLHNTKIWMIKPRVLLRLSLRTFCCIDEPRQNGDASDNKMHFAFFLGDAIQSFNGGEEFKVVSLPDLVETNGPSRK